MSYVAIVDIIVVLSLPALHAQQTLLTDCFGKACGEHNDINQGRVYSIHFDKINDGRVLIKSWDADNKQNSAADFYGSAAGINGCGNRFTLTSDDFIVGHTVWSGKLGNKGPFVFGLEFYTRNGNTYTCVGDSSKETHYNSYDDAEYDFWYLTGFKVSEGAIIDGIQFEFTESLLTASPTPAPTTNPTRYPTPAPTNNPTANPSAPTDNPSSSPSNNPSISPTHNPSKAPTNIPTNIPSKPPTYNPTTSPPTNTPSSNPTSHPTETPAPTNPTQIPTKYPTPAPTTNPTKLPTNIPTSNPTLNPSLSPTNNPTVFTSIPTNNPSISPTLLPTPAPILNAVFDGTPTSSPITTTKTADNTVGNVNGEQKEEGMNTDILALETIIIGISLSALCLICIMIVICYKCSKKKETVNKKAMEIQMPPSQHKQMYHIQSASDIQAATGGTGTPNTEDISAKDGRNTITNNDALFGQMIGDEIMVETMVMDDILDEMEEDKQPKKHKKMVMNIDNNDDDVIAEGMMMDDILDEMTDHKEVKTHVTAGGPNDNNNNYIMEDESISDGIDEEVDTVHITVNGSSAQFNGNNHNNNNNNDGGDDESDDDVLIGLEMNTPQ